MKDWIPFRQSLVWPTFIALCAVVFRSRLSAVLDAVRVRVERGDAFEAGTSGIKLGAAATPTISGSAPEKGAQALPRTTELAPSATPEAEAPPSSRPAGPTYYLVHKARRDRSLDRGDARYYRIGVYLDSDEPADLEAVTKVVYHLHPTFPNPDRVVSDADTSFRMDTSAWGEFNMTADVHLKGAKDPIHLQRYLNF